ncbi:MAG TPA: exosortase O, partial [Allocoleopsis sp.]
MKKNLISITLLITTWFYANYPALKWLFQAIIQASTLNIILVILILSFAVFKIKQQNLRFKQLEITPIPLLLILLSSGGAIAISWLLNISQLKVVFFLLGLYGILGLFLDSLIWRKNLPTAMLIACILPHATQFSNGLGVPVRILTANVVEKILTQWHITAVSSQEIVVLENGIAHIDAPCSGLKSLWTGTLFLLIVTWLENRIIGLKWLLVFLFTITVLVINNIFRILILVLLYHILNQPIFAKIVHLPLGILGFIIACGLGWLMLKLV